MSTTTASTIATGGGGGVFEHQVAASFLALVLTHTFIPVFPSAIAIKLHLQAGRLGWKVDDFLVEAVEHGTLRRKLSVQVKRTFTVSKKNGDCVKAFRAAWADFHNAELFNPETDGLALVVHLGTKRLFGDFGWLLQQCRISTTVEDFRQRLNGEGIFNNSSKGDYETIRTIIANGTGIAPNDQQLWAFLRCFYLLNFDLTSVGAKDEASVLSLLALLAAPDSDPAAAAGSTWSELKNLTATGAGQGASYARDDLPKPMVARHRKVGASEHRALTAIREHSEIVLGRVADTGTGGLSFSRVEVAASAAEAVTDSQVTLIVGPAGSGKSVLAKRLIRGASLNEFTVVFAAEEFRAPHIDNVLANAQIGVNWATLRALLCLHPSKTILVEGLERLLESDDRRALIDLMQAVAGDPTFRLVLTCRDYHAQTVDWVMLGPSGVTVKQVIVPELTDAELDQALAAFPLLAVPFSSQPLRRLLRNPFILNQAAKIDWQGAESLPSNEKALRERLWRTLVRRDDHIRAGMPTRRAATLISIALARARSLKPFVEVPDGDPDAVTGLASNNLITFESNRNNRAAPAHDIYEDWALIEWLHGQFEQCDGEVIAFAKARDPEPALRRSYRRWLHELIETQLERATDYVEQVTHSTMLPEHLRDDTLIAVFQSSEASTFLKTFAATLLAQDAALLKRIMQLVRVSGKTVSPLASAQPWSNQWHIPTGAAWPNLLDFLATHWDGIPENLTLQVIQFLDDWSQGVSWMTPYPEGSAAAGLLLEKLWPVVHDGYRDESPKQRVLSMMLKVPKVVDGTFRQLADRRIKLTHRRDDCDASLFGENLVKPFQAMAASRDYPTETMAVSRAVWKADAPEKGSFDSGLRDVASVFGIKDHMSPSFFPQSALQGPFKSLLQYNTKLAVPFVVSLLNDAADHYGKGLAQLRYVDLPASIELKLNDGRPRKLWANARLWNAYRGLSVMPDVLQCALMALESWLLEMMALPELAPLMQHWLMLVLKLGNNVSTVGVVCSICMAHPNQTVEASLILLGCRPLFELDQARCAQEHAASASGGWGVLDRTFQQERLASNRLPHRKKDLEQLARDLQLTDQERVWAVLDAHLAALPPVEKQDDKDRLWRLALARMDLRKYEHAGVTEDGFVKLQLAAVDTDVQQFIDRDAPQRHSYLIRTSLMFWSMRQFAREADATGTSGEWSQRLIQARQFAGEVAGKTPQPGDNVGAIAITAAVCLRDRWDELNPKDLAWCIKTVREHVLRPPRNDFVTAVVEKNPYSGVAPCANVTPLIWLKRPGDRSVIETLIAALTHYNQDVRTDAIRGVSEFALRQDPAKGSFCTWVMVTHCDVQKSREERETKRDYNKRTPLEKIWLESRRAVLKAASKKWYEQYPDLRRIGFSGWAESQLAQGLIQLLVEHLEEPAARDFFERIASALRTWWALDRRGRENSERRDFDLEHNARDGLARFLLTCDPSHLSALLAPILDGVEKTPKGVAGLMMTLLSSEDRRQCPTHFWNIWKAVADRAITSPWIGRLDERHGEGQDLIRELFLNTLWRENIQTWSHLGEHFRDIDWLYRQMPPSTFILEKYAHYLYHIGRESLPDAFITVSAKLGNQLDAAIASDGNNRWYFETLLSRTMYTNLARLKSTQQMRAAVMSILDALVNAGSSVAFRLRDDFVTP